jgi:thioredoxin 1
VEDLAKEFSGRLKVMKLNVDENPQVAMKLKITGIPTVLLFKNGQIVDQAVGALPKRLFVDIVEKHIG